MREIKFRTWDKKSGMCYFSLKDMWEFDSKPNKKFEDMKWIQYTGLKDITGKEIYDGDILEYNNVISVVEWNWYRWVIRFIGDNSISLGNSAVVAKIIGNIYETPELLGNNNE